MEPRMDTTEDECQSAIVETEARYQDKQSTSLLHYFKTLSAIHSEPLGKEIEEALEKCKEYLKRDYKFKTINNKNGVLCASYPPELLIPEQESRNEGSEKQIGNLNEFEELDISDIHEARCWYRFPVPVIFYNGKYICRSSTISVFADVVGKKAYKMYQTFNIYNPFGSDYVDDVTEASNTAGENGNAQSSDGNDNKGIDVENNKQEDISNVDSSFWQQCDALMSGVRQKDIDYLHKLNIGVIADLMVETKKLKFFKKIYCASSEKIDKNERYKDFKILSVPYPGCEQFSKLSKIDYDIMSDPEFFRFNWSDPQYDAPLTLPRGDRISGGMDVKWEEYKSWSVAHLTQNYLKLILRHLAHGDKNVLVHCISGWDRTPLFISLLRLTLWADDLIHQSLTVKEMLYFTLAYDWMLFGHRLKSRIERCEEIMCYAFCFLECITGDEYRMANIVKDVEASNDADMPMLSPEEKVEKVGVVQDLEHPTTLLSGATKHRNNSREDGASPHKICKSSPVMIPGARRRAPSEDSNAHSSLGSWQLVNKCGALDSEYEQDVHDR